MLTAPNDRPTTSTNGAARPPLLADLAGRLHREAVRYCHWKGTFDVRRVSSGEGDADLLVHRADVARFEAVLAGLGFKRAIDPLRPRTRSVCHFYGLDEATGALVHLHVYYRLVAGTTLLDDYALPLEELLLHNTVLVDGMHVAEPRAALTVFVCRMMFAASSLADQLLRRRDEKRLRATLEFLLAGGANVPPAPFLARWLPSVQPDLFYRCLNSLRNGGSFAQRYRLGRKLRRQLAGLRRLSWAGTAGELLRLFVREGLPRLLRGRRPRKQLAAGGAVIAFVGPDASGKSTLAREAVAWLGQAFRVRSAHLGKPPPTCWTLVPNLARRFLRWVFPRLRATAAGTGGGGAPSPPTGLLHRLRDVLIAYDRRALAVRLRRRAADGEIVVCDRYPSPVVGALDSAVLNAAPGRFSLRDTLTRLENWLYRQVPPPDVLVHVVAPLEVALERNRLRQKSGKGEPDEYIRRIHNTAVLPSFPNARLIELDTNQPEAEARKAVRRLLWETL
jgi:thymidylate kinase